MLKPKEFKQIPKEFFEANTVKVAKDLIGKILTYHSPQGTIRAIINETEAYREDDASCHAYGGKVTNRNEVMFREAGHIYIYFIYGLYHCLNIVTESKNFGCAVLIRSVIPIEGDKIIKQNRNIKNEKDLTNGPAKICTAFNLTKQQNGIDMYENNSPILVEDSDLKAKKIQTTKRIGISKDKDLMWRFLGIF